MDEQNDGSPGADGKFETGLPWVCFPCESLGKAQAAYKKDLPDGHDVGQFQWGTTLIPRHTHAT